MILRVGIENNNERWSIDGILKHIGGGEWFYQERIGHPFPENEADIPSDPFERLQVVRDHFISLLPKLDGVSHVIGWRERSGVHAKLCGVHSGMRGIIPNTSASYSGNLKRVGEIPTRRLKSPGVQ